MKDHKNQRVATQCSSAGIIDAVMTGPFLYYKDDRTNTFFNWNEYKKIFIFLYYIFTFS